MDGIICINKPKDFTSFDVIAKMRGISKQRKIGHAGTLDPMATGVLPLLFGTATKACDIMPDSNKTYVAGFKLGVTTNTQDMTGEVIAEKSADGISKDFIENYLSAFCGEIEQIPPMFSAVQVNGQRLYDLARQGVEVKREPRKVTITDIKLIDYSQAQCTGTLEISCTRGTYIRTIIHDLGQSLGCGAAMTELVRTKSGQFALSDCITLEQAQKLSDSGMLESVLMPTDKAFAVYPEIVLNEIQTRMFKCGVKLDTRRIRYDKGEGDYRIYGFDKSFIGMAHADSTEHELKMTKSFFGQNR